MNVPAKPVCGLLRSRAIRANTITLVTGITSGIIANLQLFTVSTQRRYPMPSNLVLNLVAIREEKVAEDQPTGFRAAEIIRCPHCSTRYWLLIAPLHGSSRQQEDGILDALRMMTQIITSEHETGHSPRLSIPYRCSTGTVNHLEDHVCSAKTRLKSSSA